MKNSIIPITLILLSLGFGCKKVEPPQPIKGKSYAPLEVGKYITYKQITITHDAFAERSDTSNSFIKETLDEQFISEIGDTSFKIAIEHSSNGINWQFARYAILTANSNSLQSADEDVRTVKLSFPFKERKSWDVNQMNSLSSKMARMKDIDEPYTLPNGISYPTTTYIDLGDDIDQFFSLVEREVYAEGIGLIYWEYINTERQPDKYLDGTEYYKTIHETNW